MHVNICGFEVGDDERVDVAQNASLTCKSNIMLNIGELTLWVTPTKLREIATKTAALADALEGKGGK